MITNGCLEVFAALVLIMLLVSIEKGNIKERIDKRLAAMIYCHLIVLLLDAARWFLSSKTDIGALQVFLSVAPTILALIGHAYTVSFAIEFLSQRSFVSRKINFLLVTFFAIAVLIWTLFILINNVQSAANMQTQHENMRFSFGYWMGHLSWGIASVVGIWLVFRCRRHITRAELLSLISYSAFPLMALVLRFFWDGAQIFLSTSLSLMWISVIAYREQRQRLGEKEIQLAQSRIAIVLSRVQPEYFDKILEMICAFCDENAKVAKRLTEQFAEFLRYNLEAVNVGSPIPFKGELRHAEVYLELEQHRLGDRLDVVYSIGAEGFCVPPLTIQPLVENAVMQSMKMGKGSCQIGILTKELSNCYEIEIVYQLSENSEADEPLQMLSDCLINVKERLWLMCKASLEVHTIQKGAVAVIAIPKAKIAAIKV